MKTFAYVKVAWFICSPNAEAWKNGPDGNAPTDTTAECNDPPYSTHDWVADKAMAMLPEEEKAWLSPHKAMYLLGTEAPDNNDIPTQCGAPNTGYDDRSRGHSVEWVADWSDMTNDRAARRAQEEYEKAVAAFDAGNASAAAFYLGAMAHYIEGVVEVTPCWFESSLGHQIKTRGYVIRDVTPFCVLFSIVPLLCQS